MRDTDDPRDAGPRPPFDEEVQSSPGREAEMQEKPDFGEQSYVGRGRMKDKVTLITGGDSGIGRAVALAFAREGADVGIAYLDEDEDAALTSRHVADAGRRGLPIRDDLADPAAAERIARSMKQVFGRVDVLVNNAAFQGKAVERFEDLDPERIARTFAVNVEAMFHLVRACLPLMKPGATIINVASIQCWQPSAEILDYAATKGAIVTFTKGLAQSLVKRGIRVNAVAPGPVWTPLIA